MQVYTPRSYQLDCTSNLASARADGITRGLVVMASGLGKTLTAAFDIERYLQEHPNARILVLCHQENILFQTKRKFQQYFGEEYSYGMYSGSYKVTRRVDFTFATFQLMRGHREEFAPDAFDYIVVDEAHHTPAATYRPTVDYFQAQFLLGLTATKDRMDGQDILNTYGQTLFSMDIFEGWEQGYLARVEYNLMLNDLDEKAFKQYLQPQDANVKLTIDQLNKTFCCVQTDADLVASIRKETSDLTDPTIFIFCNSIAQVQSLAYHFGGEAAMVHSKQSYQQNQAILDAFYAGEVKIILSVDMLNEGIDIPAADVVVFLRATDSQTVFFQQLGRGARITEGKRVLRVLDYVANVERLMMVLDLEYEATSHNGGSGRIGKTVDACSVPIEIKIPSIRFEIERVDIENLLSRTSWNQDRLLEQYYLLCKKYGHWLSRKELLGIKDAPHPMLYFRYLGGMRKTRRMAIQKYGGLDTAAASSAEVAPWDVFTEDELIEKYYEASKAAGHWIKLQEMRDRNDLPCVTMYQKIGGITAVRKKIVAKYGDILNPFVPNGDEEIKEMLLRRYHNDSKDVGHWLSFKELSARGYPTRTSFSRLYGGIKMMRQMAEAKYGAIGK